MIFCFFLNLVCSTSNLKNESGLPSSCDDQTMEENESMRSSEENESSIDIPESKSLFDGIFDFSDDYLNDLKNPVRIAREERFRLKEEERLLAPKRKYEEARKLREEKILEAERKLAEERKEYKEKIEKRFKTSFESITDLLPFINNDDKYSINFKELLDAINTIDLLEKNYDKKMITEVYKALCGRIIVYLHQNKDIKEELEHFKANIINKDRIIRMFSALFSAYDYNLSIFKNEVFIYKDEKIENLGNFDICEGRRLYITWEIKNLFSQFDISAFKLFSIFFEILEINNVLIEYWNVTDSIVNGLNLIKSVKNLKNFTFECNPYYLNNQKYLRNIEHLELENKFRDDYKSQEKPKNIKSLKYKTPKYDTMEECRNLKEFEDLEHLDIDFEKIDNMCLSLIFKLNTLKSLKLRGNSEVDTNVQLDELINLKVLDISDTSLENVLPILLEKTPNLEILKTHNSNKTLNDEIMKTSVKELNSTTLYSLENKHIDSQHKININNELKKLNPRLMANNKSDTERFGILGSDWFVLKSYDLPKFDGGLEILNQIEKLRVVNIKMNYYLAEILFSQKQITHLEFKRVEDITLYFDDLSKLKNLTSLMLRKVNYRDNEVNPYLESCKLERLSLIDCINCSNCGGQIHLPQSLTFLEFQRDDLTYDNALKRIAELPNLKELHLIDCNIDLEKLEVLKFSKNLKKVVIKVKIGIESKNFELLKKNLMNSEIEIIRY